MSDWRVKFILAGCLEDWDLGGLPTKEFRHRDEAESD
jgi:hypothetical protein